MDLNKILIYFFAFVILYNIYTFFFPIQEGLRNMKRKQNNGCLNQQVCEDNKMVSLKDKLYSLEKKLQTMETNIDNNKEQIGTNADNIKEFAEASKKHAQEQTGLTDEDAEKPAPQVTGIE